MTKPVKPISGNSTPSVKRAQTKPNSTKVKIGGVTFNKDQIEADKTKKYTLNGKKMNIRKTDFLVFADSCGITRTSALKMIASIASCRDKFIKMCDESLLPEDMKENLISLIINRITALQ